MSQRQVLHRNDVTGWRARSMLAVLGLRPPRADHTEPEGDLIVEAVCGARTIVEIGAFEGGASIAMRAVMRRGGTLFVVDPYRPGRLGFSAPLVVARRAARRQQDVTTRWLRTVSVDAAATWTSEVDACVIDAIHSVDGVREEWQAWGRFVRIGGRLVARNDLVAATDVPAAERSRLLLLAASPDPASWTILRHADTLTAYERVAPAYVT